MANKYKVICSTNALGMGIDKPDIGFVIHYHITASPIHHYQEIGRAGRDGKSACCVLLYDPEDLTIQRHFIDGAKPSAKQYETTLSLIRSEVQGWRFNDLLRITGFARHAWQNILADLEEQGLTQRVKFEKNTVYVSHRLGKVDANFYELIERVRTQKELELADIQNYAQGNQCYMGYLTAYLGDIVGQICGTCGNCGPQHWPNFPFSGQIEEAVEHFLERIFLPRLEKCGSIKQPEHEAGWHLGSSEGPG